MRPQYFTMIYSDKQLQIIGAAEKLFAYNGFEGTSVRDIAEQAGVNVAMISYYFGSKEKLLQALFEQRTKNLTVKIEGLLKDDTLTPFRKLEIVIDDYVERVAEKQRFYKLMICEQMLDKNRTVTGLLKELKKKNSDLIVKLIEDGQRKKAFRKNIDVVLLMNTLFGVVMHSFLNQDFYKYYHELEEMTEEEFYELLKNKLNKYIKDLFKATLSYEG